MKTRIPIRLLIATGCFLAGAAPQSWAHGELHELIEQATRDIEKNPRDPLLYLKRAELHRAHVAWDAAMADIERATALTNQWPELHLARSQLFLDAQWFESCTMAASRYLAIHPTHVLVLTTRARARAKLGQHLAAAEDYTQAIRHSPVTGPELFLERAQAVAAAGDAHLNEALRGVEEALQKLGPIVTLQLAAIDIEVKQQRIDAALARIDTAMAKTPRKETWLARKGEILQQVGRSDQAREAFRAALAALEMLPPARRNVPAMRDLQKRIQDHLAALK